MDQLSKVCIIIPERNEKSSIRGCLEAVLAQDYPQNLVSILVVDGVSTDGTREILAECGYSDAQIADMIGRKVAAG